MSTIWTADRDQKLFLLNIQSVKMDYAKMSALWAKEYPNESYKPTAKAIEEHVSKLKRQVKGSAGTPRSKATSTPKNAAKRAAPKTPVSSNKKARTTHMSEEDDSEEEKIMTFDSPVPKREPSRRSASARKSYAQSDSEDDGPVSSAKASRITDTPAGAITNGDPRDSHSPTGAQRKSIARSKNDPKKLADVSSDEDDSYKPIQQEWV